MSQKKHLGWWGDDGAGIFPLRIYNHRPVLTWAWSLKFTSSCSLGTLNWEIKAFHIGNVLGSLAEVGKFVPSKLVSPYPHRKGTIEPNLNIQNSKSEEIVYHKWKSSEVKNVRNTFKKLNYGIIRDLEVWQRSIKTDPGRVCMCVLFLFAVLGIKLRVSWMLCKPLPLILLTYILGPIFS
jgi:hypothetical protein